MEGEGWGVVGRVRTSRICLVRTAHPARLLVRVVVLKQTGREVTDADKSEISKLTPLGNMASNL